MRFLIKLAIAAIVANAGWHMGSAYMSHFKFKDAVAEQAQFGGDKTEAQLHDGVMQLASDYDVPVSDDQVNVHREGEHTFIDGSYQRPIELFPGFRQPWTFSWHIDVLTVSGGRIPPLK